MTHMKHLPAKPVLALLLFAALGASAAQAQSWSNSGMYNGYGASSQNNPSAYSMRDANNNLTMVNGQVTSAQYSTQSGSQYASSGVGTGGAGSAYGQATAIGNSLNVVVVGRNNTTIIDTTQINNGNQTATAEVNTH